MQAVETLVVGTVVDYNTGLPIANANVYYKGTTIGCATDDEGLFFLRTDNSKTVWLIVSAVGYKQQKFKIEPGTQGGMQVELQEINTMLEDVFAIPDDSHVLTLLARTRASRAANDIANYPQVSSEYEERAEVYFSQLTERHLKRRLWKNLQKGMLITPDSDILLPVYSAKKHYLQKGTAVSKLEDDSVVAAGPSTDDYSLLLTNFDTNINFYHSSVNIMGKEFLSPLAGVGNNHYRFFLADSVSVPEKHYIVHFRSKNAYSLCFNGEMEIDSLTCAIRRIEAFIPREASVNYLTSYKIEQVFDSTNRLSTENLSAIMNPAIKSDSSHIFPSILLTRSKHITNTNRKTGIIRPFSTQQITAAIDSTNNTPVFRIAKFIAHIINTGNIPTGTMVDIGNVTDILGYSKYEGFHIGLPFVSNQKLLKNVEFAALVSYGFRDHAYKGKGQVRYLLPIDKRHIISASYSDGYSYSDVSSMYLQLRENNSFCTDQDFTYMLLSAVRSNSAATYPAVRRREFRIWSENEWTNNLETEFNLRIGKMGYGSPLDGYYNMPSYKYKTLSAMFRVGFEERKIDMFMRRIHVHNNYPVLYLMLEGGSFLTASMERERLYGRVSLMVKQNVSLGICGTLSYAAMAGGVIGKVPYPMLEYLVGNQTYTYDPYRFTLANQMQYAADFYIMGYAHWNMQGLMFNAIPYIQRLHLRELFEFKIGWGMLSNRHNTILQMPDNIHSLSKPYIEAGVGIGNILRVADVYAVFRLTNNKDNSIPWWGIRTRFSLDF